MMDLAEAPALAADRRWAAVVAAAFVLLAVLVLPVSARPLGASYFVFAIAIAWATAALAVTAVLLWAQARVTFSVPLTVLAAGYALTSIVMVSYLLFYRDMLPQFGVWASADAETSRWLWVEWHAMFIGSAIAYYWARGRYANTSKLDVASFERLRMRVVGIAAAILVLSVPPLIWIDGLPALVDNGHYTELFSLLGFLVSVGVAATIVLAHRTSRFRSVLDLWLALACLSMFADVALELSSKQFTVGWYASRFGILFAAGAVLLVLLFQTARIYTALAVVTNRLRDEALTDPLTGLANRRCFDQRFVEMLRDCARETRPLSLLAIDIDHFKIYNDTFGHQAGDECLRTIAAVLRNNVGRARDLIARTGGEEIAVIMPEVDLAGALVVAERMRVAVQAAGIRHGAAAAFPVVTVSVGVTATLDCAHATAEEISGEADRALYRAKSAGRNRIASGFPLERVYDAAATA
jgi:diguanylate cyclase (GGDEF)-like protein